MKKAALLIFLLIGAISMIVMSYHYFLLDDTGVLKRKEAADKLWFLITFRTHIFLGLVAITVGPAQFIKKIRDKYLKLHKGLGYVYVISIIFSSFAGLIIAQFAMGGSVSSVGFSVLSIVWLFTTIKAVLAAINGDIISHQKWMFLSYGATFAAITQRTLLLLSLVPGVIFLDVYRLSAWLPWILNLTIAHLLFKRTLAYKRGVQG